MKKQINLNYVLAVCNKSEFQFEGSHLLNSVRYLESQLLVQYHTKSESFKTQTKWTATAKCSSKYNLKG
jgi:hypothetical protein